MKYINRVFDMLLVCVVFFLLCYAFLQYALQANNAAMIISLAATVLFSIIYYTVKSVFRQRADEKNDLERLARALRLELLLLPENKLYDYVFITLARINETTNNTFASGEVLLCFCDDASAKALAAYLRTHPRPEKAAVFTTGEITDDFSELAKQLQLSFIPVTVPQLVLIRKKFAMPLPEPHNEKKKRPSPLRLLLSPLTFKFAIKYGIILLLWSIITPYKSYYIVSGAVFIALGVTSFILVKRHKSAA